MKRDVLQTTVGSHNVALITGLKNTLVKYYLSEDTDITYGYRNINGGNVCFITGKNEEERKLPIFTFPIISEDLSGNELVFVDIRSSLTEELSEETLASYIKDDIKFVTVKVQAIFTLLLKSVDDAGPLLKGTIKSLGGLITNMLSHSSSLNAEEYRDLNIVVVDALYSIYDEGKTPEVRNYLVSTLLLKDKVTEDDVAKVLADLDREVTSIKGLVENIAKADKGTKLSHMNLEAFTRILKTAVFGQVLTDRIMLGVEHLPSWIAVMFTVLESKLYKKTQLANFLNRNSRALDTKDFLKLIETELKLVESNLSRESDEDHEYEDMLPAGTEVFSTLNHSMYVIHGEDKDSYRLYLGGIMDDDKDTASIMEALRNVKRGTDELEIIVQSGGGIITQGMQLYNSILGAFGDKVTTVLSVYGRSMGAILYCMGTKRVITKYCDLMFHNYSAGMFGKGDDIATRVEYTQEMVDEFMQDIVIGKGFMSEEEYSRMQDGHDYWMREKELIERGIATHMRIDGKDIPIAEYVKM